PVSRPRDTLPCNSSTVLAGGGSFSLGGSGGSAARAGPVSSSRTAHRPAAPARGLFHRRMMRVSKQNKLGRSTRPPPFPVEEAAERGSADYLVGTWRSASGGTVQGMLRNGFCLPSLALRTALKTWL